jgi:hypothetical protein
VEVTVLIDNREKKPLSFPTHLVVLDRKALPTSGKSRTVVVRTQPQTLKTGDYRLVGGTSAIERKGSFSEIANNCLTTDGRRRFLECCRRLRDECRTACILFEGQVGAFEVQAGLPHPGVAADSLLDIMGEYGLPLMLLPLSTIGQRRAAGEWSLRWLLSQEHHGTGHTSNRDKELSSRIVHDHGSSTCPDHDGDKASVIEHGSGECCVRREPELPEA